MELHIDFDAPLEGEARNAKIKELASQHPVFLQCRDGQSSLAAAQQHIRHMPGVSVRQADDLCEKLMKAGQTFNLAVKTAVEDWADQKLQGNELKKTISNWGHDGGHRDEEREEELRAAHQSTLDLRCQLHTHRERFGNIKFEAQCIIKEFEKLRVLDEDDKEYREGVMALHKRLDAQIQNHEKLFSLVDDTPSPSTSEYGLLGEIHKDWVAKNDMNVGSQSDVFSQRSNAPSPDGRAGEPENNMQMVLQVQGPRHPQPHAIAYPGSSGNNHPATPANQQGQTGVKPLAASAPHNTLRPLCLKTPAPDARRRPVRNNPIRENLGSPASGALVVPSPLESPFEGPGGRPFVAPPQQRLEPSFRFPGTPIHMPQAVHPTVQFQGRGGRARHNRATPQPQHAMATRPSTAFRPQAAEFRPEFRGTLQRAMAGANMAGPNVSGPNMIEPNMGGPRNGMGPLNGMGPHNGMIPHNAMMPQNGMIPQNGMVPHMQPQPNLGSLRRQPRNNQGALGRGLARGGGFQASTVAGSSSKHQIGREGLDSAFLNEVEKAIDELYQLTRGWVTDYAGSPDARQALTVKESAVWPAIVAAYPPLTPLEANAYIDIHIRDPFYRPCLISRIIVDFFIARAWTVFAWMGFDDQSDRALVELRDDFDRLGPQPAFQRQLLLERQADIVTRITTSQTYSSFRTSRISTIHAELTALLEPLTNRYAPRERSFSELRLLAEQGWEVARLMAVGRTHFDFRFPHTGDRFSASAMRPVFPDKPAQQLQAEHWRVSLVVSPSVTCIRDNGGRISVHDLFLADVVCMQ